MSAANNLTGVKVANARRIAVLRANAIGDLVVVLPALDALRAAYPEAEIVLLGKSWHAGFLAERPGPVDRVVVVPPSRGVREDGGHEDALELERFFRAMRRERFDLALQLHGGGRYSNPFVRRLGAVLAAGLKAADAAPLDRWIPYVYYQPEILRFLEVVALVGAEPVGVQPRLAVTERDLAESLAAVPDTAGRLVALHPGAHDPRRRWPAERFAAVGDALARAGARVLVTGGESEGDLVGAVVASMREPAEGLAGRLSLHGLAGLLSRCALVISNDTGPRHLAEALGTPTVGIYWCGNAINAGPVTRALHRPLLSWVVACPVCGASCTDGPPPARTAGTRCAHNPSFVEEVEVDDVLAHALDLLALTHEEDGSAGRARRPSRHVDGDHPDGARRRRDPPQRVAVLRALQLGDLLCAVPAFRALRAGLPKAEITLIGLPWARELVPRFHRYLDGFLELPGYPGLPEEPPQPERLPAFLERARAARFDLALQLHGSGGITNPLVALLGARRTAGFFVPGAWCPDDAGFLPYPEGEPEARRLLRLLEFLGFPSVGEELEFPIRSEDREELASLPETRSLVPGQYVCLHPGGRSAERWGPEAFAQVGDDLSRRGLSVVLTGVEEERETTRRVASTMAAPALDLAGRTTLGALGALLAGARLLVTNDTGVSHLAAALRLASVVVFTSSDPGRWAPLEPSLHRVAPGRAPDAVARVLDEVEELLGAEAAVAS